jgi:hypothetical protein
MRLMQLAAGNRLARNYATWDPAFKGSSITLSGGNLTAAISTSAVGLVRATLGKNSGKWYWEVTGCAGATGPISGVVSGSSATTDFPGGTIYDIGYYSPNGGIYNNSSIIATFATYSASDVIGYALDPTGNTLGIYKNGVFQGNVSIGTTAWFPAVGQSGGGSTANAVANFGASAFAYSVPAGYNAGLYN